MRGLRFFVFVLVTGLCGPAAAGPPASLRALLAAYRCDLVERLERIHGGDRSTSLNRFIVVEPQGRPAVYVQCIFRPGDRHLLCEAASGGWARPGGPSLSRDTPPLGDPAARRALGFVADPDGGNDRQDLALADPPDLAGVADLLLTALHDGYGVRMPVSLVIKAPFASLPRRSACPPPTS